MFKKVILDKYSLDKAKVFLSTSLQMQKVAYEDAGIDFKFLSKGAELFTLNI